VGFVMRVNRLAAISADRDKRTRAAFDACIVAAKDLIGNDGPIRPSVQVGRLTGNELGWITSTTVSAWVRTRAEQAASEGWNEERAIRTTGLDPDPWFSGAIDAILPKLAEACPDLDWSLPVGAWPKDAVVAFLTAAITLTRRAVAARNVVEERLAGKAEASDALLDDPCPF
jgi:hypothetical protein